MKFGKKQQFCLIYTMVDRIHTVQRKYFFGAKSLNWAQPGLKINVWGGGVEGKEVFLSLTFFLSQINIDF